MPKEKLLLENRGRIEIWRPAIRWLRRSSVPQKLKRIVYKLFIWFFVAWIFFSLFEVSVAPRYNMLDLMVDLDEKVVTRSEAETQALEKIVLPEKGVVLPIVWGGLGKQLIDLGVVDKQKFEGLYATRGGFSDADRLLMSEDSGLATMNKDNAGLLLNLLWAFGLANQNSILDKGSIQDPVYEGPGNFASTGGWSLANTEAMDHYSKYNLVALNAEQDLLLEDIAKNIFRPCCDNSVYFPDCNHGMAMLGLLELMIANGVSEADIYKVVLQVNSFWFPDTYLTLAKYFARRGVNWGDVDPKMVLGSTYSSGSGFAQIKSEVEPVQSKSQGGGCGA